MKKDGSRDTFHAQKHYRLVLMQQGRVQLDADWNEQGQIVAHRIETEARDTIGPCGAPIHDAGFEIIRRPFIVFNALESATGTGGARAGTGGIPIGGGRPFPIGDLSDFLIEAGRFYAGGLLCINEQVASYLTQPDFPSPPPIVDAGLYLVYLDVWQRHITALDDPSIREVALGGPDTATRDKNVWQVKVLPLGAGAKGTCVTTFPAYDALIAPPTGKLTARARKEQVSTNPCIVPPGAGYRGLENQLYRVEVHDGGSALDAGTAAAPFAVTRVAKTTNQVTFTGGSWHVGQAVEFVSTGSKNPLNGTVAHVAAVDGGASKLTLDLDVSAFAFTDVRLRPLAATYKWSRDNGSVVTSIENIAGVEVTVHDVGPDDVLGFDVGQWVEITDDGTELNGLPGVLAQIVKKDRAINLLTLNVQPPPLVTKAGKPDLSAHPKLRRWDGIGAIALEQPPVDADDLELENGVLIRFSAGTYRTGDYWTIPARTATADAESGNIEWPADGSGSALAQSPFGIHHHYCRLAMLQWDKDKRQFDVVEDCRRKFPPLTELMTFVYIGGDGQESLPGDPLEQPLQAGVFNGSAAVAGARVRFVAEGNGRLATTKAGLGASTVSTLEVPTLADGIATCFWRLDPAVNNPSQQVIATWLDADANALAAIPFNGNLSIADQVFYDPGKCATLAGNGTVQKALDRLSHLVSLYEVSGNDQIILPGATLQLVVLAANRCGPVTGQNVQFKVISGKGSVAPPAAPTDGNGLASTTWTPDPDLPHQEVEASISGDGTAAPTTVRFTANLSIVDSGIHVVRITTDADGGSLENDRPVVIDRLLKGITIDCDAELDPLSAGNAPDIGGFPAATPDKPTCLLTIDLPYPIDQSSISFWDFTQIFGYQPLIVAGNVVAKGKQIHWDPTAAATRFLIFVFSRLQTAKITDRLLAHLTLKGNFIWSAERPPRFLDGEVFGDGSGGRTAITLPSGDGRKGGDLEMWFWLEPAVVPGAATTGVLTIDASGLANRTVRGRVTDQSGGALLGITVTLTPVAVNVLIPPRTVVTDASGNFSFGVVQPGPYRASATVGGVTIQRPVQV